MGGSDSQALDHFFAAERERHLAELADFLRIPSVSALPAHRDDMVRAAGWVAEQLRAAGVPQVETLPTAGHPVVWGAWPAAEPGAPTALIYGHYDTQPADPLDLWETAPFEPTVRDGRLYARGASDDKGNLLIPLKVVEAYRATAGRPPLGVVFLFEGEEEIGSPNLRPFLSEHRDRLRADVAISADSAMWSHEQPSVVLATKGLAGVQLDARGTSGDLHSGLHGGMAPNVLNALASLLASMRTPDGRITVEGFYDGVRPLTDEERREIAAAPFDEVAYKAALGADALVGEPGFSPLERNWARPTLDLNGMWGGFQGEGSKTVIPATAGAKITCRLVPDQDPARVIAAIEQHVRDHCPPGVTVKVTPAAGTARAYAIPRDHPALLATRDALRASYGREPLAIRVGGTLPITEFFKADLGLDTVCLAWEMPDENLHGPNEFLRLENFDRGLRVYANLFQRLARTG
ncbi:MAG: Acetylornithine deacetylase/Succinyl-diaminopimelate desuccinylase and related deacylases [uncultured Thermomicrobiales bacterium]|uniref:Acetylornithine deacetylase/Succinyl-diaminopimelate desuccinylase and related deacylases n=1 Tax=uncultured Thermomicrobiales bacterium TaxID=1645740 RepID=A0A6J4VKF7_9BACT|nr:MAG: Acetylornithine deacetylase/Succinyl-diaminopimelate desuccinylase and related deacylases [uncultured Thermomicrobiales bacterium]